jgi:hypothetical protein
MGPPSRVVRSEFRFVGFCPRTEPRLILQDQALEVRLRGFFFARGSVQSPGLGKRWEAALKVDRRGQRTARWARRSDATFLAIFALAVFAIVTADAFNTAHDRARAGHPVALWEPAVWEFSSGLVLFALAPLIMWQARRAPPAPPPAFGWLAWHVATAVGLSLVHVLAMGGLRWAAYLAVGAWYDPFAPLADWPYELRKDLLVYGGVVICYLLWRGGHGAAAPADHPPELIEVRDGARRLFVPIDDILWVEAAGNYVELHRRAGRVLHRASLAELERRLAGAGFVRIHRSRLVRRAAIASVETRPSGDFAVRLATGETLAGSRRFRAATRLDRGATPD